MAAAAATSISLMTSTTMVVFEFFLKRSYSSKEEQELELGFLARGNNALWKKKRLRSFFQPKVFGCTKSYGGSLRLSRLLWLFIVLWPGWRVGEHQFSSPNCPRSFQCGEHFPSSPSFPSNNCLHKKKRAIVKSCQQRTISSTVATKKPKDSSKS